ncbi:bacteriocin immunity protein [Companilactobacillus sp.]|uniref:bacteriocin immunity protein n=1 Tax=Companilactobacillus sp. TaxID=2767905 RepID=UPI0025BEBA02|nr:bacteriocin immunity protein [Companilactobacillus sp.]MCH4008180.1 bacteriocin immunity protein [Companilactobacillus sp.]MCH4051641.1 bacteriocin immunity protein [Companilactobacillus sp.]MCH4076123.1 bacteriocin immunity protein [Companilactobacillus sp.]MCH4124698.1 bacteriocin immunity protein [Companilactobacillus sp.]MCH4131240.1 bacteriocin immunity protein [Companilactobacillus sp.]
MTKINEEEKANQLMDAIHTASLDEGIKKIPEIYQMLIKNAKELKKTGNYHDVSAELNRQISFYAMGNPNGPKALDTLYQATIDGTHGRAYQKLPTGFN